MEKEVVAHLLETNMEMLLQLGNLNIEMNSQDYMVRERQTFLKLLVFKLDIIIEEEGKLKCQFQDILG
jgi:hypothetical protein